MTLVLDSNVALRLCATGGRFGIFGREDVVAPPLMWSEFRSGLHEAVWRGETVLDDALDTLRELDRSPIVQRRHRRLGREAWRIAELLGWARTYDAEYVALANLLGCRLVTLDLRLRRGTDRLGFVITPAEL